MGWLEQLVWNSALCRTERENQVRNKALVADASNRNAWSVAPGPAPCGDLPVSLTCGVCTHIYICSM